MKYLLMSFILIFLNSCTVYRNLSEEDKLEFKLEKIDIENHQNQPDSVLYSIDHTELKELISKSDDDYQLIIMHVKTCTGCVKYVEEFKKFLNKFKNTSIYLITQSDQTRKEMYADYLTELPYKRYMLDSEKYSFPSVDAAMGQSHIAKEFFLSHICPDCEDIQGTLRIILLNKELKLLYHASDKVTFEDWDKYEDKNIFYKEASRKLYETISKITNK